MQLFKLVLNKVLFFLSSTLLIVILLLPKFPFIPVHGTYVSIRIEDFLTAVVFLYFFIYLIIIKKIRQLFSDDIFIAIALFLFIGLVSLFSGVFLTYTITPSLGLLHYFRRIEYLTFLPLMYVAVDSIKRVRIFFYSLLGSTVVILLYAFGQQYFHLPIFSTTTAELSTGLVVYVDQFTTVNSTFAGHYDLSVFLLMAITVMFGSLFYFLSQFNILKRESIKKSLPLISIMLLSMVSIFVLILTGERITFIATILALGAVLIFIGKKSYLLILIFVSILIVAYPSPLRNRLVSTFTVMFSKNTVTYSSQTKEQSSKSQLNIPTLFKATDSAQRSLLIPSVVSPDIAPDIVPGEPVDSNQLDVARSIAIRLNQEWPRAIRSFLKNPLLGTGYSSIGLASDNDYLRSLAEVGILGTLGLGLIIFIITKRVWLGYKSQDKAIHYLCVGVLAMIFAVLVDAVFTDVFEASKIAILFWSFSGVILSLLNIKKEELK